MKKILLVLFVFSFSLCEGQSWDWGREAIPSTHGEGDPIGDHCIATDASGNVYMTAPFSDTLSFGSITISNSGIYGNLFLVKYNGNGNALWAKEPTTASVYSGGSGYSVAADASGNSYLSGVFYDTISFGPFTLRESATQGGIFLAKYNSAGNVIWAKQGIPASNRCYGYGASVAVDKSGNVYLTGDFIDTVAFGVYTLSSKGVPDAFIAKYDPTGNLLWAKQAISSNTSSYSLGYSIAVDLSGNAFIAGYFTDSISFGPVTLIANKRNLGDAFITKYDTNGSVLWAKQAKQSNLNSGGYVTSLAVDVSGNSYVIGHFSDTLTFGAFSLSGGDFFLVKYGVNGNVIWAKENVTGDGWYPFSVACDTLANGGGYAILSGGGTPPFTIMFGTDSFSLNTAYSTATVLMQFDSAGKVTCGSIFSEGNEDDGDGVCVDHSGKYIYIGGDLFNPVAFGEDSLEYGGDIPFIARWQPCLDTTIETSILPISNKPTISLPPTPPTVFSPLHL